MWPTTKHIGPAALMKMGYERFTVVHIVCGLGIVVTMTVHFAMLYIDLAEVSQAHARSTVFSWNTDPRPNLPGFLSWLFLVIMALIALFLRRKSFHFFRVTHMMFWLVIIFGGIHHWPLWVFLALPMLSWFIDLGLRVRSIKRHSATLHDAKYHNDASVVEIVKAFDFELGQYCYILFG